MMRGAWSARDVAATGAVVGSMLALGYALAAVPGVELLTLTAFLGGWLVGATRGALAGGLGMFLFSLFNPLGPALPPVHAAQTLGMALAGAAGGWTRRAVVASDAARGKLLGRRTPSRWSPLFLGALGALLTVLYDVVTNAATAVAMGLSTQMAKIIAAGIVFAALHIGANAAIFAVLGPTAIFLVEKRRAA